MSSLVILVLKILIGIALMTFLIMKCNLHPAISMLITSIFMGVICSIGLVPTINAFNDGFGATMKSMGVCVFMGIIMAKIMGDSGMANVIAKKLVKVFPKKLSMLALMLASFVISIPVFFDVNILIMLPIAFAVAEEVGAPKGITVACVCSGAALSHSLIPPTPGPLSAIAVVNGNVGIMIAVSTVVSLAALLIFYPFMMKWLWPDTSSNEGRFLSASDFDPAAASLVNPDEKFAGKKLPGFSLSLLPIIVPVGIILVGSVWSTVGEVPSFVSFISEKGVALLIGAMVAYFIAFATNMNSKELMSSSNQAINQAGNILIITSAGGAFGKVITSTGIGDMLAESITASASSIIPVLFIAFAIGFLIRLCTGSVTSSAVIVLTLLSPTVTSLSSVCNPVWVVLASIIGTFVITLPNSSGFWMTVNVAGLKLNGGLKFYCVVMAIPSVIAMALVCILAPIFPLV